MLTNVIPEGKLSVSVAPVMPKLLGLLMAMVNTLVALTPTTGGAKPLLTAGATTVIAATAGAALEPPLVLSPPVGMVLM